MGANPLEAPIKFPKRLPRGTPARGGETALELHVANDYDGRGKASECSLLLKTVPYDFF
jgi:hypothetical protein